MTERGAFTLPHGARVLEIGCAEADWISPTKQARKDLHITGIDWRGVKRLTADKMVMGDARERDRFQHQSFDRIVSISAMEHIGLGAYDDPIDDNGDSVVMANCLYWLKPGGQMYFDVPYRQSYIEHKQYRGYDDEAIARRLLQGWQELARHVFTANHPDSPYVALVATPA